VRVSCGLGGGGAVILGLCSLEMDGRRDSEAFWLVVQERMLMRGHGFLWSFYGVLVVRCGRLKCEGPPQLSLQADPFLISSLIVANRI
jgi:hypothetical protein